MLGWRGKAQPVLVPWECGCPVLLRARAPGRL